MTVSILSVAWSLTTGTGAVAIGIAARSQALTGFGMESIIDAAASVALVWRFRTEGSHPHRADRVEQLAARALRAALLVVAAYLAGQGIRSLITHASPDRTATGVILSAAAILVLPCLAHRKLRLAGALSSRALRADGVLTAAGALLALAALASLALDATLGWWWADPAAAILIAAVLMLEGLNLFPIGRSDAPSV